MEDDRRASWRARVGLRRRDFLLAVPLGVIAAVSIDLAVHPNQLGLFPWGALAVSGGALAFYLGLQVWDRRPRRWTPQPADTGVDPAP